MGKTPRPWASLVALVILLLGARAFALPSPPPLKGIALGLFDKNPQNTYRKELLEIRATGANAVLLMVHWFQYDIFANKLEPRPLDGESEFTTPDLLLSKVIRQAHLLKLKVVLFPYLRLDHRKPREWRGILAPRDFNAWALSYKIFILHYAALAAKNGVEYFSVGSEMGSLESKTEFWSDIISEVRAQYRGKLLYSANWDHYTYPTFWKDLDYIALTSYYELTKGKNPSLNELMEKWREIKEKILQFQSGYSRKIILTEAGYPSIDGAAKEPWNYYAEGKIDLEEQALCYRAFMETWGGTPQLEGVFWWVWWGQGGPKDNSYTPRDKPAEQLLKAWYQGR